MKPLILIVDDERSAREGLARYLSSDYIIYQASNGLEAIKQLHERSDIKVVLSDIMMPEMDGFELLEKICTEKKDVIVIFMTAYFTIENKDDAMQKGAYDYLTKPLDLNKLETTIKNAIKNKN